MLYSNKPQSGMLVSPSIDDWDTDPPWNSVFGLGMTGVVLSLASTQPASLGKEGNQIPWC